MINSVSKILAALLAVLLLYVYPAVEAAGRQDDLSRLTTYNTVTKFVDAVRTKGYITPTMYEQFQEELALTGNTFDVKLEHMHKNYVPEYTDPMNQATFTGKFEAVLDGYYDEQIMEVLFPNNEMSRDEQARVYKLTAGDFFRVTCMNTNRTPADLFKEWLLLGQGNGSSIHANYGGMVINEDY